jgi:hypothetical protein
MDGSEQTAALRQANVLPPLSFGIQNAPEVILHDLGAIELPAMMLMLKKRFVEWDVQADLVLTM